MVRWPAIVGVAVGLAITVALIVTTGAAEIWAVLVGAGWGVLAVIVLHLPQIVFSALGWRVPLSGSPPPLMVFVRIRWIRESINCLLPVAQILREQLR